MNPGNRRPVRGGKGCIGLWCALLLWVTTGEAIGESAPFYRITAESNVTLPVTANQDPRTIGMEKAKKTALERLLRRMFTHAEMEKNRPLLETLQGTKGLTERVRVVGETQRANKLLLSTEVLFSAKEVTAALAQKGLSYNESPHPPVLFVVHSQGGSGEETAAADQWMQKNLLEEAKSLGLPLVTPMGDVDDMAHLTWDLVASSDPALRQWAKARYAVERIWGVAIHLTPLLGKEGKPTPGYTLQAQLLGGMADLPGSPSPEPFRAEVTSATSPSRCTERGETRECPYAVLARTLLQKMADHWIQTHTVNPSLNHIAHLRVVHGPKLAQMAQFVTRLRTMPGLASLKFVEERATESTIQISFQGQDAQLRSLLSQMGAQVEEGTPTIPPAVPGGPEPPPSRTELLLRLP